MPVAIPRIVAILALAGLAVPGPALAQSNLERIEAASESVAQNMADFLVGRVPDLAEVLPEIEWDDAYREVGQCTLDRLQAEGGAEMVEAFLSAMEDWAEVEITSLAQMGAEAPAALSGEAAVAIAEACGGTRLSNASAEVSGLNAALARPEVVQALIAD